MKKRILEIAYVTILAAVFFEFLSVFSFAIVGEFSRFVFPFSFVTLLSQGSVMPIVTSLILIIAFSIVAYLHFKKGAHRYYGLMIFASIVSLILVILGGIKIFYVWSGIHAMPSLNTTWLFIESLSFKSRLMNRFYISMFISISILLVGFTIFWRSRLTKKEKVYGDAHFANPHEIKKAGFFNGNGIIVGKSWGKCLRAEGYEHVLCFSPAGSGKTTSIAIPNLLIWQHSCVVNDPKYELFEQTSLYRQNTFKNEVYLFAPTRLDGKTHRFNPLKFVSKDSYKRISEIQLMSHTLIPNGQGDPIWFQSSRELFLAILLYLLDTPGRNITFGEIYNISKQHKFNLWLTDLVENTTNYDAEFYRSASSYLNSAEKTRASILKTFTGYLEIFANPIINAATSESDFDLRDLRRKKMTIYIGFPDNEKEMISPLLTIFWQQLIAFMTEKLPSDKEEPYDLLCLMEEFSTLGRLVNLKNSLKILRGYRVRVLIIIQYLAQTLELYSRAEAEAFKNIKTKLSFALDSLEDSEYVSKLLGMQTKKIAALSSSQSTQGHTNSKSHSYAAVPLLRPEEIQRISPEKMLIMRTGHPPIMATQYRWYKQKELKSIPAGAVDVPRQKPLIIPLEPQAEDSSEKNLESEEKAFLVDASSADRVYELEIEKAKIQADVVTKAVIESMKKIRNID